MKHRPAIEGFIRWVIPLLLTATAVSSVYLAFRHVDFPLFENGLILAGAGASYLTAATFVLVFTRRWELRSLGQVVSYIADGCLYLILGLSLMGKRGPITLNEQNWIRAGFVVGGPCLVLGLLLYAIRLARDRQTARTEPASMNQEIAA